MLKNTELWKNKQLMRFCEKLLGERNGLVHWEQKDGKKQQEQIKCFFVELWRVLCIRNQADLRIQKDHLDHSVRVLSRQSYEIIVRRKRNRGVEYPKQENVKILVPVGTKAKSQNSNVKLNRFKQAVTQKINMAGKVAKFLSQMKELMWELNKLHDRILTCASFSQEEECRNMIAKLGSRFAALARKCKTVLRRFEIEESTMQEYSAMKLPRSVHWSTNRDDIEMTQMIGSGHVTWHRLPSGALLPLSSATYIPAEIRMPFHLHSIFSYKLTCLVREYYVIQKIYGDACRSKIQRQLSIIGREMEETELEEAILQGEKVPLLHGDILDDDVVDRQMQARIKEVEVLHKEILDLEKNIEELHQSFVTISTLVHEQGAIIDQIEEHVSTSADYIEESTEMLKKASSFQHKYRKKKFILAIVIAVVIVVIILIIVISVKKKQTTTKVVIEHAKPKRSVAFDDISDEFYDPFDQYVAVKQHF